MIKKIMARWLLAFGSL